jgi:predicted molibdopterin-dependent oxidoreductase YjgC
LAEQGSVTFDLVFSQPEVVRPAAGALTLVAVHRLYDGGTLMQNSDALQFWVADPYVGLNQEDASALQVLSGDKVRITSSVGSIELWARVDADVPRGAALVPDLEQIPLADVQTGVLTAVRLEKVARAKQYDQ